MSRNHIFATVLGALCIFAGSRLVFAETLHVVTDEYLWQLTSSTWLVDKSPWSVVLSYHAQPPGLLTLQWAAANLSPKFIDISLLLSTAVYVSCSSAIVNVLTYSRVAGLLAALYISFEPSTLLYSHWFFSSIYLAACAAVSVLLFMNWARSGNAAFLAWTAVALAVASLFHAAYLAAFACFAIVLPFLPWVRRRDMYRAGTFIPLLFAVSIAFFAPVKNFVIFETFSSSSWAPLNLATFYGKHSKKNVWERCEASVRASTRATNDYGTLRAASFADSLDRDLLFRPVKPKGKINLNHLDVLKCREKIQFFEQFDLQATGVNLVRAIFETIVLPAWDYHWLGTHNLEKIRDVVKLYELYLGRAKNPEFLYYGTRLRSLQDWLVRVASVTSIVIYIAILFCTGTFIHSVLQRARQGDPAGRAWRQVSVAYAGLLALLVLAVVIFANGQELNRMKFPLSPLFLALLGDGLRRHAGRWWPARFRRA